MLRTSDHAEDLTDLLNRWTAGEKEVEQEVVERIYPVLRRLAARQLQAGTPTPTLQTTELVQEAYLRLVEQEATVWESRLHFFAIAARVIRRIAIDLERRRRSQKRGGDSLRLPLAEAWKITVDPAVDLLLLHDALSRLGEERPELERLVELRFFGGLSLEELAAVTGIGRTTAIRKLRYAKAWLRSALERMEPSTR
jgi:RNA polymerase sigma factor (TIGR02999 family)